MFTMALGTTRALGRRDCRQEDREGTQARARRHRLRQKVVEARDHRQVLVPYRRPLRRARRLGARLFNNPATVTDPDLNIPCVYAKDLYRIECEENHNLKVREDIYRAEISQLEAENEEYKRLAALPATAVRGELVAAQKEIRRLRSYHNSYTKKWVEKDRLAIKDESESLQLELLMAEVERDEERKNAKRARDEAKHDEEEIGRLKKHLSELQWLEAARRRASLLSPASVLGCERL